MTLYDRFLKFIDEQGILVKRSRIVLAVSGGKDSVTLLHLFSKIQKSYQLDLIIAHLNHQLRGAEADADEQFVKNLGKACGLPVFTESIDVREYAGIHRLSIEEAGRSARFNFLHKIKSEAHFDAIALGHHLDDHAETVLMNLFRGQGLRGLRGIRAMRDDILHPLLFASRSDIDAYVHQQKLSYREDQSNSEKQFKRNRIRLEIIQSLKLIYGESLLDSIRFTAGAVAEAQEYIGSQAEVLLEEGTIREAGGEIILDICQFLKYFIIIQKEALFQIFQEFTDRENSLRRTDLQRLLKLIHEGKDGQRVLLQNQCEAVRDNHQVFFYKHSDVLQTVSIPTWGEYQIEPLNCQFRISKIQQKEDIQFTGNKSHEYIDMEKVSFPLTLRARKEGDLFYPICANGKKKLHDYFIDEKIPRRHRDRVPLLECGSQIIWVVGHRLDHRFRITHQTRHIAELSWILNH